MAIIRKSFGEAEAPHDRKREMVNNARGITLALFVGEPSETPVLSRRSDETT